MGRRTFTFEQQSAELDFIEQGNEFLIRYDSIIIIKVDQKLSNLFQGTHCFSRQVDVVPPQAVAAKVTSMSPSTKT